MIWLVAAALAQVAPVEGPQRIAPFFDALARLDSGGDATVRITHLGDSHVAADMWTGPLRTALQTRFGDGGRGFVLAGRAWRSYVQAGVRTDSPGRWRVDGLRGGIDDGLWAPGGCSLATSDPAATSRIEAATPFTDVEVHFVRQPAGGCFGLRADERSLGRVSTRGPWLSSGARRISVPDGATTLSVRPLGGGETRLLGVSLLSGRSGVVYDALGTNGAKVSHLLRPDVDVVGGLLERFAPSLVVLSFGANELYDDHLDRDRYATNLARALTRVRRAAPGSCLLTGPPDMLRERRPPPLSAALRETQRALAAAHGCAFWDAQAAMGGPGSIRRWKRAGRARGDFVHLTRDGYGALADALFSALMTAYDVQSVSVRADGATD